MKATTSGDAERWLERKAARLVTGAAPRVLDLFAGAGGISLGFHALGCQIVAALEVDELAAATHAANFFRDASASVRAQHAKPHDITEVEPEDLVEEFGLGTVEDAVDLIVGGPPCQAYARVGRAKLREVAEHPEAFKVDPRGNLYLRYLHYVRQMKPLALLMENVPDIMNYGGHNVAQEVAEALDEMGYEARYSLLNSAFYGVPQMRDRVILLAIRKELGVVPEFPVPERHMDLPSGYDGTRAVAYKFLDTLFRSAFVEPPEDTTKPFPVTCSEAIGDLPPITLHLEGKLRRGARRFKELIPYDPARQLSQYARCMREWPRFESAEGVYDHVIRYLPRDGDIFRHMPNGAEYPEAHRVAVGLFEQEARRREQRLGRRLSQSERADLHRAMVPPYPINNFPNRWWKLRPDYPSRTLMAHIGKDTYSHIHYDSAQARVISVREAARLQSFPDGFRFEGTMNPAFRQIGNAVPPLFAKAMGAALLASLARALGRRRVAA
jgi:DNA (cytosine-5)-methyltransferase 1